MPPFMGMPQSQNLGWNPMMANWDWLRQDKTVENQKLQDLEVEKQKLQEMQKKLYDELEQQQVLKQQELLQQEKLQAEREQQAQREHEFQMRLKQQQQVWEQQQQQQQQQQQLQQQTQLLVQKEHEEAQQQPRQEAEGKTEKRKSSKRKKEEDKDKDQNNNVPYRPLVEDISSQEDEGHDREDEDGFMPYKSKLEKVYEVHEMEVLKSVSDRSKSEKVVLPPREWIMESFKNYASEIEGEEGTFRYMLIRNRR